MNIQDISKNSKRKEKEVWNPKSHRDLKFLRIKIQNLAKIGQCLKNGGPRKFWGDV